MAKKKIARKKTATKPRSARVGTPTDFEMANQDAYVPFEAVLSGTKSMFADDQPITPRNLDLFRPAPGTAIRAATLLAERGFRVRHIGTFSISGEAKVSDWQATFRTEVRQISRPISPTHKELGVMKFFAPVEGAEFIRPEGLSGLIDAAYPQQPPTFYGASPLPPRVGYHHLRVPDDVAAAMRASLVHRRGITGTGVLVAMPDTGFYKHPFYAWHGYDYNATLAPDAVRVERDEFGHGTAEAANIFACAPDIDFIGIKMGINATLAFKMASDLHPGVISCSWGYDLRDAQGAPSRALPNRLRALEAAIVEAVRDRGITVCFSAGNGQFAFPGQMPEVISVGGVFSDDKLEEDGDFVLTASNYSSSFLSEIYPGRRVPDVCGLVGQEPGAIYIMLPVEPGDFIDRQLSGGGDHPAGDMTAPEDGWAVLSGTSAAAPQVAGVCALLKQVQPGLSPELVKSILKSSARDVTQGQSAHKESAGEGTDGATGYGLVDAMAAYKLARSIKVRDLNALPGPR